MCAGKFHNARLNGNNRAAFSYAYEILRDICDKSHCEKCDKPIIHETTVWCLGLDKVKHQYCQECAKEWEKENRCA